MPTSRLALWAMVTHVAMASAALAQALRVVMRWRFAPSRVDGAPVPVIMTVTVSFALR